jgi:hypothetical protein
LHGGARSGEQPETSYEALGDLIAALAEGAADNDPGKWARLRKFRKAFSLADVLKVALVCSDKAAKLRQKAMIYALLVNTGDRQGDLRLYRIGIDLVRDAEDDWCHGIRQGKTGKTKEVDALWPGTSALIDRHVLGNRPEWQLPGRLAETERMNLLTLSDHVVGKGYINRRLIESLIRMAGLDWPAPDFSTLCRRQARIAVQIPYRASGQPLNLLVDSTEIKFRGDGALSWFASKPLPGNKWQVCKHGASRRSQWRKVHIAMDIGTDDVRAVEFTSSRQGDSPLLPELLSQILRDELINTVTADGAYDTRRCHGAIIERGANGIIPVRRNGRAWKDDCPAAAARNEILRTTRRLGRAVWRKWSEYHIRSRVEARMNCLKLFGERNMSRTPTAKPPKSKLASPS